MNVRHRSISIILILLLVAAAGGGDDDAEPAAPGPPEATADAAEQPSGDGDSASTEPAAPTTTPADSGDAATPSYGEPADPDGDDAAAPDDTTADADDERSQLGFVVQRVERSGGELILAVEQWPECLNPVTSCANSTWMIWSVATHLVPSLMELDPDNAYRPSPTLL